MAVVVVVEDEEDSRVIMEGSKAVMAVERAEQKGTGWCLMMPGQRGNAARVQRDRTGAGSGIGIGGTTGERGRGMETDTGTEIVSGTETGTGIGIVIGTAMAERMTVIGIAIEMTDTGIGAE